MQQDDQAYYRRRLIEEEKAIRSSGCVAARERHEELAAAYRVRLQFSLLRDLVPATLGGVFAAPVDARFGAKLSDVAPVRTLVLKAGC